MNSSAVIVKTVGTGGIPVRKKLRSGVVMPTSAANCHGSRKPATKTGMCIGKNMGPPKESM
uniref:Uncharacterized protein n=1 Tax=Coprothermobacter proteolyticus (strain ATCC 35245 / DSM 5265 / OCM 4 / BT) TaxID=309798 RepID=B5Y686_COPPD